MSYKINSKPDQVIRFQTSDQWEIALSGYLPKDGIPKKPYPILCCHGLGANGLTWAFPGRSFAEYFNAKGYEVWALDLRGHGLSEKPTWTKPGRYRWDLDTFLMHDVYGAIEALLQSRSAKKIHWIGLSMGGILAYSFAGIHGANIQSDKIIPFDTKKLASMTAVAASLDYSKSKSDYHFVAHLPDISWLIKAFPLGPLMKLEAPFVSRFANRLERFIAWETNISPLAVRQLYFNGFHTTSTRLLYQLATLFKESGIKSTKILPGTPYFSLLKDIKTPIFSIAGDRDSQCPPDATELTHLAIGCSDKKFKGYGKDFGQPDHYGHFDLIIGDRVASEVYPDLEDWFGKHNN